VSEEPKTLKVAICIPSYGDPKFKFVHSFTNMLIYSLSHATINDREGRPRLLEIDTFMVSCSIGRRITCSASMRTMSFRTTR
jgi:hypothetical protein